MDRQKVVNWSPCQRKTQNNTDSPHGWLTGDSGHAREKKTGEKASAQSHKTRQVIKCTCLICKCPDLPLFLRICMWSGRSQQKRSFRLLGCTKKQRNRESKICTINFGERLLPILRTRDRERESQSADFTDPCFLLAFTASDRALFFNKRQRQRFFLIRR
jgi:hypothetical protein